MDLPNTEMLHYLRMFAVILLLILAVTEGVSEAEGGSKDSTSKSQREELNSSTTNKSKNKSDKMPKAKQKIPDNTADLCKELRFLVQEAQAALSDLRSRNAEQAFSQALGLLEAATPKKLGLSTLDLLLLLFGRASALTEIGQPDELAEAKKLLERMNSFEERRFQCLVYYGFGRVLLRENRFKVAMQRFSDSLQMVKNQITPGKLTWPLTKEIVKETQLDAFKEMLEKAIELCKFPPPPDAVCRLEKCLCPLKAEIYFTDPDFKGYIQICCCQSCRVEFHINCWKSLKSTKFFEKSAKDILNEPCLTPDCVGKICSIRIICPTGLVKCKFETTVTKPEMPKKPKVNQKATSVKKLKSKEDQKQKRKTYKQTFKDNQTIGDDILQKKDNPGAQSQQKAWLVYRDRVLLQISQNMDLLREEQGLQVSALTHSLQPWLELDWSRGNLIAGRLLNWQQEQLETLGQAVELLLERKNRVWARVFIQQLSSCVGINSKLSNWACQLDTAGLNAAQSFIDRHSEHLEHLDLAILLNFDPLKEMILEKLDTKPEFFSSLGLTVTEYLKQASADDMRLFIWTLEEHREDYVSCHTILDEYFDMMDGHCSVLKKPENENNSPSKAKNRGRKKKRKGGIGLSGMWPVTPREEWDQDFFEDNSLSFLHPGDPFSVPSHLRDQVADFEDRYHYGRSRTPYRRILENPDPTKESLYDYFAQILEEHGPLADGDRLLVGELQNFPAEARKKIAEAGGLEAFLLESFRFIKLGMCIGLAQQAGSLQQAGHGASLDDLDEIVDTHSNLTTPDLYTAEDLTDCLDRSSPICSGSLPVLPNPYLCSERDALSQWYVSNFDLSPHFLPNGHTEPNLGALDDIYGNPETNSASHGNMLSTDENCASRHAAVQTCPEATSSVAVNTELYKRFERCQGDIIKQEKSNRKLVQKIAKTKARDKVNPNLSEDIILMEKEINEITTNIQVTNKELAMFQQKLEEEVKKDQKEKKANQEELKSLKTETEQLVEEQGSLSRTIREKMASYTAKFNELLELSNQSAAEKMSLEDEINRSKALLASASRRSQTAQLSVAETSRDQGLYGLYRELAETKALLSKLDEAAHRTPCPELEVKRNNCKARVDEVEKNISSAERRFQEQLDQVKDRRVSEHPPVDDGAEPGAASLPAAAKELRPQASAQAARSESPAAAEAPLPKQHKPAARRLEPQHVTVFEKAMESLTAMFPDYSRHDLMRFIQEFRTSRAGSLYNVSMQDVVSGVAQLILDHQERLNSARANILGRSSPAQGAGSPLVTQNVVWQRVTAQRVSNSNALNMEDPCIICHEDMGPEDTCVLECRHSFHDECIRSWLKEQNTCPTCRTHALLSDDFPALSGRRRQAP